MPRNSNSFLDFLYTPFIISSRAHTNKSPSKNFLIILHDTRETSNSTALFYLP